MMENKTFELLPPTFWCNPWSILIMILSSIFTILIIVWFIKKYVYSTEAQLKKNLRKILSAPTSTDEEKKIIYKNITDMIRSCILFAYKTEALHFTDHEIQQFLKQHVQTEKLAKDFAAFYQIFIQGKFSPETAWIGNDQLHALVKEIKITFFGKKI